MDKRARNLRRMIAYHEAGHAVVARKLGVEAADIEMTPSDDRAVVPVCSAALTPEQTATVRAALARGL